VLQVSASIGLASWEDRMGHGRAWLHEADTACYGAKRAGRAGVFVSEPRHRPNWPRSADGGSDRPQEQADRQCHAQGHDGHAQQAFVDPVQRPGTGQPPTSAPAPSTSAGIQCTSGDSTKKATAEAFMTPASTFLVAPALRVAMPAIVSAASIRKPMPPPK
jgi:hypothetical protein